MSDVDCESTRCARPRVALFALVWRLGLTFYGKSMDDDDDEHGIAPVAARRSRSARGSGSGVLGVPGAPIRGHDNAAFAEPENQKVDSSGD